MGLFSRGASQPLSEQLVLTALSKVQEPELGGDIVSRRMVKAVRIDGGVIGLTIELTTPACPLKDQIHAEVEAAVRELPGVTEVGIEFTANTRRPAGIPEQAPIPGVANVVAVAAGKGGVGKSTVAANLAVALSLEGARVGLLDADVFGPSMPLMFGVRGTPQAFEREPGQAVMIPLEGHGIKLISVGFLVDERQPVIWRGPMVSQLLRQFLYQVEWGELDYLIIDMPPGTGDIALTLAQSLPLTGALIVTTPQAVATIDVVKAMEMFKKVNVPLLGLVENMAYFLAPDTGARYNIFGEGGAARLSAELGVPLLGQIPLGMAVREGGDSGAPAVISDRPDAYATLFRALAGQLAARISVLKFVNA
jgi:ATP-binding protein involved in chromosome partitioning